MDGELLDVVSSDEESAAVEENDRHTWSTAAEQPRENEGNTLHCEKTKWR
jgi:hypothetical protein